MANVISNVMDYKVVANNAVKMFNNVDDVVDYVVMMMKKHPNNAIYVNDMGIRLEWGADGRIGVVLRDSELNLIRGYVMGKIKRGMDKAVAYVMESVVVNNNKMEENNMTNDIYVDAEKYGFSVAGLDYVNENMERVDVDMIKECIEECVEDLCLAEDGKRIDFEGFCDVLWTNYVWDRVLDSGCTDEALENETRYVMEFNDRVRYIVENDIDMLYINCYDEIGVDDMVKNDAPCLDEDEYDDNEWSDRDLLIKNTADTIKDYLGNYMPSYLDKFGDCVITVYWDEFTEDMMKNMIEDDDFAEQVQTLVYGADGIIYDFLVYDDGVYVTVDYDRWFNKVA